MSKKIKNTIFLIAAVCTIIGTIYIITSPNNSENIKVTSYDQSGGITANEVNIGTQQRKLTSEFIQQLESTLSNDKNKKIEINVVDGDAEALRFANKIKDHLVALGYKNVQGVNKRIYAKDWTDAHLFTGPDSYLGQIIVGRQK